MSGEISYFATSTSSAWYAKVKEYLDDVGIFDEVVIGGTNPLVCKIGNTTVFDLTSGNTGFTFYSTNGTSIFTLSGGTFTEPCYIAKADNMVYISTNNGTSLREFIFGKDSNGDSWWTYWFSNMPTGEYNIPRGAYFNGSSYITFEYKTGTNANYSQTMQVVLYSANGFLPIDLLQFINRQTSLPAINGGATPYCYKVNIGGKYFITSGQFLLPYTE